MTKHEAAIKLFKHGPLSVQEFVEISRWSQNVCYNVLSELAQNGELERTRRGFYQLASAPMLTTQVLVTIRHRAPIDGKLAANTLAARAYQWLHAKGGQGDAEAKLMDGPAMIVLDVKEMRDEL